ncbi:HAMP domain-containing protein [sulfur-oxidizing endosymbiont of Gigantopelta aegis]|uniref:HAMP domain-containing protein n=1 Tax=sulfur-oxidizing endosymbiont of Gigantopelta aegis TaxID=2794934 RepID=UPI0018DB13FB|nr:HAMP domain-containing protein [sulfur-oxidizing endosymbiont of Gigantopelta aegis]
MNISLKYRIALTIFVLEAIMLSVVLSTTLSFSEKASREQLAETEQVIISALSQSAREALFIEEYDELQDYIDLMIDNLHVVNVMVLDSNDRVVAAGLNKELGMSKPKFIKRSNHQWRIQDIYNTVGNIGKLAVEFSSIPLLETEQAIRNLGITTAVIGMIFIAVVGSFMGYLLTVRLTQLSSIAKRFAEGEFSIKSEIKGSDEIAKLGSTFNYMANETEQYIEKLRLNEQVLIKAHNNLEQLVSERTLELKNKGDELALRNDELNNLIAQLQQTQEELIQSRKMALMGELVAGVAHELNTPIGISITAVSFLEDSLKPLVKSFKDNTLTVEELATFINILNQSIPTIMNSVKRSAMLVSEFKKLSIDNNTQQQEVFS